ncbi:uncharacterized protein LOC106671907 [Cimex lectularius]|uniref:Uncharacterized protein n=1 Tax=Cimex lectularius TaxID=79782 RepID=A0A8I6TGY9_CIMLE|nr:uncharacterized protein LOC106671907 [Cimex lectularius]
MSSFWVMFMGLLLMVAVRAENWEKNCDMNCTVDEIVDSYIDTLTSWWLEASIGLDTSGLDKSVNQIKKKLEEIGNAVDEKESWFIQRQIRSDWEEYIKDKRYIFMRVNSALTWHMTLMDILEKRANMELETGNVQEKLWPELKVFFSRKIPLIKRTDNLTCKTIE